MLDFHRIEELLVLFRKNLMNLYLDVLKTLLFFFSFSQILNAQSFEGFIHSNGADLYYKTMGTGEPIVILHGGPGLDHTYLLPQLKELSLQHKIIFYDQRATGRSTGNVDSVSMSPHQFVEDLETLRKELKIDQLNLLGHSWGALLAMHYASRYPNNLKTLILVNAPGPTADYFNDFIIQRTLRTTHQDSLDYARIMSDPGFAAGSISSMQEYIRTVFKAYLFDRKNIDRLTITFNEMTAKNIIPIFYMSLKFYPFDLRASLAMVQCRTLIMHGDHDVIPVQYAEQVRATIRGSKLVVFKECGHFPFIEHHAQFIRSVEDFMR